MSSFPAPRCDFIVFFFSFLTDVHKLPAGLFAEIAPSVFRLGTPSWCQLLFRRGGRLWLPLSRSLACRGPGSWDRSPDPFSWNYPDAALPAYPALVRAGHSLSHLCRSPFWRRRVRKCNGKIFLLTCYPRTAVTMGTQESHLLQRNPGQAACVALCKFRLKSCLLPVQVAECVVLSLEYLCALHFYSSALLTALSVYSNYPHPQCPPNQ